MHHIYKEIENQKDAIPKSEEQTIRPTIKCVAEEYRRLTKIETKQNEVLMNKITQTKESLPNKI